MSLTGSEKGFIDVAEDVCRCIAKDMVVPTDSDKNATKPGWYLVDSEKLWCEICPPRVLPRALACRHSSPACIPFAAS